MLITLYVKPTKVEVISCRQFCSNPCMPLCDFPVAYQPSYISNGHVARCIGT